MTGGPCQSLQRVETGPVMSNQTEKVRIELRKPTGGGGSKSLEPFAPGPAS
jgi:hypothetical protein